MMLNRAQILGRLGQDPELKFTPSGVAVCNFSLATSETWKDKATGEKKEKTEWHRVILFGKLGETAHQFLKKGSAVFVEGKLQTRSWEDKNGVKKWTTEIIVTSMQLLPQGASSEGNRRPEPPTPSDPPPGTRVEDNSAFGGTNFNSPGEPPKDWADDLPF